MSATDLAELLKLPAGERAEIAIALWESLTDEARNAALELSSEQQAELDRRWAEHMAKPGSAIAWDEFRQTLRDGT
jgi:putative addiction module component (TIGR02574 family)